jgi:hypothetical protein
MKNINKIIFSAFAGLLLFSCATTKKSSESDQSTRDTTIERRSITRPGDTITINIPNVRFKDTTITSVNYENRTVASVHYDKDGNQRFECLSAEMKEELELIRETLKNDKESDSERESSFNPQYFIYSLAILVGVLIILIIVGMVAFQKLKRSIPDVATNVLKNMNK